jgi:hypothetical protein
MKTTTLLAKLQLVRQQRAKAQAMMDEASKLLALHDKSISTLGSRIKDDLEAMGIITPHDCSQGGTRRIYRSPNVTQAIMDVLASKGAAMTFAEVTAAVNVNFPKNGYSESTIRQSLWSARTSAYEGENGYFICTKDHPTDARAKLYYKSRTPNLG